jgi:hypothetical protein
VSGALLGGEGSEIDAVRNEDGVGSGRAQLLGHVGVAGDDACRGPGPIGELVGRHFARVLGVGAETERHAERCRSMSGHGRWPVGEVPVHAVDAFPGPGQGCDQFSGLLALRAFAEISNVAVQRRYRRVASGGVGAFRGEHGDEHSGVAQRQQFVEREAL